jgi:hypothetical protein
MGRQEAARAVVEATATKIKYHVVEEHIRLAVNAASYGAR